MKWRSKQIIALLTAATMCTSAPLSVMASSGTDYDAVSQDQTGSTSTNESGESKNQQESVDETQLATVETESEIQAEESQSQQESMDETQLSTVETESDTQTEDNTQSETNIQTESGLAEEDQKGTAAVESETEVEGKEVLVKAITEEEQDPVSRVVYLSDMEWKSENHTVDTSNPTKKDKEFEGTAIKLKVDGAVTTFSKGLGTHTDSTIIYDLENKGFTRFETYAGVDYSRQPDIAAEKCDVKFTVSIDGTAVQTTEVLNPESNAVLIQVDIPEGAKELKLYAEKVTEAWSDHANWADAKFYQTLPQPQNVALNKQVTAKKTSDNSAAPINPDSNVNNTKAVDGVINTSSYFDFGDQASSGGVRESIYAQIDLKGSYLLSNIQMWRYWLDARRYAATAIVVSDDENFADATTKVIFNSDKAGTVHNLGIGTDDLYNESADGTSFKVPFGTKARYIRVYVNGVENGDVTNHIVELQANAYVFGDEIEPEDPALNEKIFPNAETPLSLEGPGTDDQVTHPDVKVFDEQWNGYKYWMAYTPNKPGSSYFENPCIAASNDGVNWEYPAQNPVQPRFDSTIENQNEHNCDTDIVYDSVNDRLIMYWEWAQDEAVNGKTHRSEIRYRVSYDGVNWGTPDGERTVQTGDTAFGCAIASEGERYSDLSPTVLYDKKDQVFKMWANDAANVGYENKENNKVWYRTSTDGLSNWSEKQYVNNFLGVNEDGKQMYPWHQDIQWVEEFQEYWALQQAFPEGSGPDNSSLRFAKSKDGINWDPLTEKALISVGAPGAWDAGQIYRSTFWYEPAKNGAVGQGTFHIWYAALAEGQSHWDIGYTSEKYSEVMYKLTGTRPEVEKRMVVNNEHPLLIMPLYGKSYSDSGSTLDWGDDLVSRWNKVPEDLKDNAVIEIHLGGKIGLNESDSRTAKKFYEQQLKIAQDNNVPVMIVVATAGQQSHYTGTSNLDAEWIDQMFKEYSCLKGIMSTENYWTDYGKVATLGADYLKVASDNGGYFIWSEHQEGVIENVVANAKFSEALKKYSDSFIFTWKNTPANTNSNAGTASYMQGLWMTGMCAQWGGLADTWKWYEKRFGKLFGKETSYLSGGEEARPVVTEPEALLGIEMMSIYTNGGSVYNFEHPAYVYGSYNQNSPCFENVIAEFMRYAIANPAPSKEEVLADTKTAFYGSLNALKNSSNLLQKDLNWADATLPTQTTGRYGLIPAVPSAVPEQKVKDIFGDIPVLDESSVELSNKTAKKAYFEEKYEEQYTGTAFGQLVNDTWYLYNSNVNVDGKQNAKLPLENDKSVDITMTPHTYVILDEETDGSLNIKLNNYRVDKDSIWEGYGTTVTDRWDTDHNTSLQDWVRDVYIPNPADNTFRDTTFELTGVDKISDVEIVKALEGQYEEPVVTYDENTQTTMITVSSNGWVDLKISSKKTEADKSALNTKLAEAKAIQKGNYTDESYKTLQDVIKTAENIVNNAKATQQQVDGQTEALTKAITGLKVKPAPTVNKSALTAKLAEAKKIQKGNYTEASYNALQKAITSAQNIAGSSTATQQQVDAQTTALSSAIKALVVDKNKVAADKVKAATVSVKTSASGTKDIKLSWKKVNDADGYIVQVKTGSKWVTVKTLKNKNTVSYTYTKGKLGKNYSFLVKAYKAYNGKNVYSKYKSVSSKALPQAPTLKTAASKGKITLKWSKISGVSGYVVRKKTGNTWKNMNAVNSKTLNLTDKDVKRGRTYYYKIKSYKISDGRKLYSDYSKTIKLKAK